MELTHAARVRVPLDRAWEVLGDLPLLASALEGADLAERDGDTCRGTLGVKVGPITARFAGSVTLSWRDEAARRVVLDVEGDELDGVGRAEATVNVTLVADGPTLTVVQVVSHLTMTGRAGQFGQALFAEVGQRLLTDLVDALEATVLAEDIATTAWLEAFPQHVERPHAEQPPEPDFERPPAEGDIDWRWGADDEDDWYDEDDSAPDEAPEPAAPRERRRDRRRHKREALRAMAAADEPAPPPPESEPEPEPVPEPVVPDPEPEPVVPEPEPEPEPVVPDPEPEPVVPEPEPEPIEPDPEPIVPEPGPEVPASDPGPEVPAPGPGPEVPAPTPGPEVPAPEPGPEVPRPEPSGVPLVPEPEVVAEPATEAEADAPRTVPPATPAPELRPVDVLAGPHGAAAASPVQRAAPFALGLLVLWLVRRLFGSSRGR